MKKWTLCLAVLVGSAAAQAPQPKSPRIRTFTEPLFGISVTYPARLHFRRDPALTKRVRDAAKKLPELTPGMGDALFTPNVGIQFFISIPPTAAKVAFDANLNLATEKVPSHPAITNMAQYVEVAGRTLKRVAPDAKSAYTPVEVKLGSRTWMRTLTFGTLGGNKLLFLQYAHFDPKTRMAYMITITELASRDLSNVAVLEQVAKTVRIKR